MWKRNDECSNRRVVDGLHVVENSKEANAKFLTTITLPLNPMSKHILPHALAVPAIKKLAGKRIVLASNSPRRREILRTFVRVHTFGCDSQLIALVGRYLRPLRVLNLTSCHRPLRKTCL